MGINTEYFKSSQGLLQLVELIIGAVVVGLIGYYCTKYSADSPQFFLFLMAVTFMIGTFCLVMHGLTGNFDIIYHIVAAILILAGAIWMLVEVLDWFSTKKRDAVLAAAVLALINGVLYCVSAYMAH